MNFTGLVLQESLKDKKVLDLATITKTETWDVKNAEGDQPKVWHAISVEGPEEDAQNVAQVLGQSLKSPGWYTNLSTNKEVFVVFPDKVFRYTKGNKEKRNIAIKYGKKIGIPESQLDWSE